MDYHVLVAEDESDMLFLISRRIENLGHRVSRAEDGEEAMRLVLREDFDLVVTDVNMPGATGLDILAEVKARDANAQVIIVTANATMENAIEALNRGAFSYLTKPFDHISVISSAVERALDYRRLLLDNMRMAKAQQRRGDMLEDEVTERVAQLSRQEQAYRKMLANLPHGIIIASSNGLYLPRNPAAERWLAEDERSKSNPIERFLQSLNGDNAAEKEQVVRLAGRDLRLRATLITSRQEMVERLVTIEDLSEMGRSLAKEIAPAVGRLARDLSQFDVDGTDRKLFLDMARQIQALERVCQSFGVSPLEGRRKPPPAA